MKNAAAKQIFENYITENLDSAYRFAYTYMKNRHDAEDVVSESTLRALNAIGTLREPQYIKVWFYRIIANTSITFLKKQKRYINTDFSEQKFEEKPSFDDYSDIYLSDILKICEGMTTAEIAAVTGVNENTVKTRVYTALAKLRKETEEFI